MESEEPRLDGLNGLDLYRGAITAILSENSIRIWSAGVSAGLRLYIPKCNLQNPVTIRRGMTG